jgi:hypothetical protein
MGATDQANQVRKRALSLDPNIASKVKVRIGKTVPTAGMLEQATPPSDSPATESRTNQTRR